MAVAAKLNQVTGLRTHSTDPGSVSALPAAVCEIATITAPSAMGGSADYAVRVFLLVQKGDVRNSQERTLALIDPSGTVSTSAFAALGDYRGTGQIVVEQAGIIDYGGTSFYGAVFTVEVYA